MCNFYLGLVVCDFLHTEDNKLQINWFIFLLVRNSLADSKGTRQEIGPVPLISWMMDLWSRPEMEGKGTFPALPSAQHLWEKSVSERERDWEKERLREREWDCERENKKVSNTSYSDDPALHAWTGPLLPLQQSTDAWERIKAAAHVHVFCSIVL